MDQIATLYEHFNTSNQTSPHFERHHNFVEDVRDPDCSLVTAAAIAFRCHYIKEFGLCEDVYFIHYYKMLYCNIGTDYLWKVITFSICITLFMFYIFIMMGTLSSKFFCPSISAFAYMLGLSENVAGVTLLAFGNGLNDLLTSIAAVKKPTRIYLTDTFGTTLFVVNFVTGCLMLIQPFTMPNYAFIRDVSFLLLDVLLAEYFFNSGNMVTIYEAILMILLYAVYMIIVISEHLMLKFERKKALQSVRGSITQTIYLERYKYNAPMELLRTHKTVLDIKHSSHLVIDFANTKNTNLWKQFFDGIMPFDMKNWRKFDRSWFMRSYILLKTPYMLFLNLFIPVVDNEEELCGWSKLLNCLQIVILPPLLVWIILGFDDWIIPLMTAACTVPLSIFIFRHTRTDMVPEHHSLMSILTLCGAGTLVFCCAEESLCIIDVLGVITNCSNTFLGATLFAWGKSFNDLLSNIILFRQGYLLMGFSGCFGTPLYNAMVSLGLFTLYRIMKEESLEFNFGEGTQGQNCSVYLIISLMLILMGGACSNFFLRRSMGIFLMIFYAIFLMHALLIELEIVHAYGADHRLDHKVVFDRIETDIGLNLDISNFIPEE